MRLRFIALSFGMLALSACTDSNNPGTDKDPGDTSDTDGPDDPDEPDVGELPVDLQALVGPADACKDSPYWNDATMATTYYLGEFAVGAESASGAEYWAIFPNPKMREKGFGDCVVRWRAAGNVGEANGVGTYSLSLSANVDLELTDCPPDGAGTQIYVGFEQQNLEYNVLELANNKIEVYYSGSGNYLAEGEVRDGVITYVTDKNCKAF